MAAGAAANLAGRAGVRVVVIGDPGTGKSSLVVAVATEQFPKNVPKVIPHTRLPADYFPDRVPITIINTSSSQEQKPKLIAECQAVDAVVLTYACDRLSTLERLSTYLLPELRRIQVINLLALQGCCRPGLLMIRQVARGGNDFCSSMFQLKANESKAAVALKVHWDKWQDEDDSANKEIHSYLASEGAEAAEGVEESGFADLAGVCDALAGLGCCRSFRNTTDVRLDGVVVGEAEQPARELLDAGDGGGGACRGRSAGGARLCSLEATPPLLLELSRTGRRGCGLTVDRGPCRGQTAGELAGDGRRGSTPMLPGSPASSAPGAVADGRRVCGLTSGGRGRTAGVRAGGGRDAGGDGAPARYVDVESGDGFDLRTTIEKN
ncbi:hypothetical protein ACQ4PT_034095 [Festuca glaucescens]